MSVCYLNVLFYMNQIVFLVPSIKGGNILLTSRINTTTSNIIYLFDNRIFFLTKCKVVIRLHDRGRFGHIHFATVV